MEGYSINTNFIKSSEIAIGEKETSNWSQKEVRTFQKDNGTFLKGNGTGLKERAIPETTTETTLQSNNTVPVTNKNLANKSKSNYKTEIVIIGAFKAFGSAY